MSEQGNRTSCRTDWKELAHFFGDQLVYRWNMAGEASPDVTLHEFMGLTWEQYAAWVEGRYGEVLPNE